MKILTTWNPLAEMDNLQQHLSSALGRLPFNRITVAPPAERALQPNWIPLIDVIEDDKEYLLKVELPEVQKEDVKVLVENGTLTISGERKPDQPLNGRRYHRSERQHGRFERSLVMPEDADANNVQATFKDGVLKVRLAKSEQAQPKQVKVE